MFFRFFYFIFLSILWFLYIPPAYNQFELKKGVASNNLLYDNVFFANASYETQRIWLSISDYNYKLLSLDKEFNKLIIGFSQLGNSLYSYVEIIANDESYYCFCDIPFDVCSIQISIVNEQSSELLESTEICQLSYGVCYKVEYDDYNLFVSKDLVFNSNAYLLSKVVEAYLTLGKNDSNGATLFTVKNLYITWFACKQVTFDDLKKIYIKDYADYHSNNDSYIGLHKNGTYSVFDKWIGMTNNAKINPFTGELIKKDYFIMDGTGVLCSKIIGFAAITVFTFSEIFLFFKTKTNESGH